MNKLLEHYLVDVEFPTVSGAEQLEMLQIRDQLFAQEATLSEAEKSALLAADQRLIEQAGQFYAELARFVDFEAQRHKRQIPPSRWWWYLDVLGQLPPRGGSTEAAPKAVVEVKR